MATLTAPTEVVVGQKIVFSVAGATSAGELDVSMSNENPNGGLALLKHHATASGGAWSSDGNLDLAALEEGHVDITVVDVTAVQTMTARVEVFRSI